MADATEPEHADHGPADSLGWRLLVKLAGLQRAWFCGSRWPSQGPQVLRHLIGVTRRRWSSLHIVREPGERHPVNPSREQLNQAGRTEVGKLLAPTKLAIDPPSQNRVCAAQESSPVVGGASGR